MIALALLLAWGWASGGAPAQAQDPGWVQVAQAPAPLTAANVPRPPLPPASVPIRPGATEPPPVRLPSVAPPAEADGHALGEGQGLSPPPPVAASRRRVGESGLPLPRYVSISATEANMRTGPGSRYPIAWVFQRPGVPVEVLDEYDVWRQVRDVEGESGWIHQSLLSGRRTFVVVGDALVPMFASGTEGGSTPGASAVIAWIAPRVMGDILRCTAAGAAGIGFCRVRVQGVTGWIERSRIWGVYPDELVN